MPILEITTGQFETFLMILMRVAGIVTISPIFGHKNIPATAKIGLAAAFSLILLPVVPPLDMSFSAGLGTVVVIIAKEIATGLLIGFTAMILFLGLQMSGHIMGFQMGFIIAQVIDPSSGQKVSILGQVQLILGILIFLAIDGHHLLINAMAESFAVIPLGHQVFSGASADFLVRACIDIFAIALKMGAPMIITLFLTDVALGIIARTVPQMNVFIVGFPLKISTGFLTLAAAYPFISYVLIKLMHNMDRDLSNLIYALSGRI
ncbi:MAG: flagellar biosynthetic protein FliR [candidate division Zixibacteria bacterium]